MDSTGFQIRFSEVIHDLLMLFRSHMVTWQPTNYREPKDRAMLATVIGYACAMLFSTEPSLLQS